MPTYTITMYRTYETVLEYTADTPEQAIEMFEKDDDKYSVELDQNCVIEDRQTIEVNGEVSEIDIEKPIYRLVKK